MKKVDSTSSPGPTQGAELPDAPDSLGRVRILLVFFFLVSGALALIYQILWIRKLQLVLGATSFAMSTVIAAFFLGLALGSHHFGKRADRSPNPVRLFGLLEMGVGAFALGFPFLLSLLTVIYRDFYPHLQTSFVGLTAVRFLLMMVLLTIPTTLMGGTLPVLTRFFVRKAPTAGRWIAILYAFNTLGAFAGTLTCGFLLIRFVGVDTTNFAAGIANLLLGGVALWLSPRWNRAAASAPETSAPETSAPETSAPETTAPKTTAAAAVETNPELRSAFRLGPAGILFASSGFLAIAYEIAWTRLLSLILKNSIATYTTILATFLLGIALGSGLISLVADRIKRPRLAFGALQCAIAVASLVLVTLLLQTAPPGFEDERFLFLLALSGLLMLVPSTLMGASLPLLLKSLVRDPETIGRTVGKAYAVNTVGSIFGSALCGFVFLPVLGLQTTLISLAFANGALGLLAAFWSPGSRLPAVGMTIGTAVAFLGAFTTYSFRLPEDAARSYLYSEAETIVHVEEGITNVVLVTKEPPETTIIYTNNQKLGAYTQPGPLQIPNLQRIQGHIPLIVHPSQPKHVLGICLGTGQTFSSPPAHPIERMDCVDISETVVRVSRDYFGEANRNVLANANAPGSKVRVFIEDGRNYVLLSPETYDVLTQEPPPHDQAGVVNLYTQEFYELCLERMNPDGIISQWLPIYNTSVEETKGIIATFLSVFPEASLWFNGPDLLLLGAKGEFRLDPKLIAERLEIPAVIEDLHQNYSLTPGHELTSITNFLGLFLLGPEELAEFSAGAPIYTDNRPTLEFPEGPPLENNEAVIRNARALQPHLASVEPHLTDSLTKPRLLAVNRAQAHFASLLEAEATYNLANAEARRQDYNSALNLYRHCLSLCPEYLLANLNVGSVGMAAGRYRESSRALLRAVKRRPDYTPAWIQLVQACRQAENYEALAGAPRPLAPEAGEDELGALSQLLLTAERFSDALEVSGRWLKKRPSDLQRTLQVGALFYQLRRFAEAESLYLRATHLKPPSPDPWISLGIVQTELGKPNEAAKSYRKALEIQPGHPAAQSRLDRIAEEE